MASVKKRCSWAVKDPLLIKYHDEEWGVPLSDDNELFERLSLEIFQAGLSWRIVLHKRAALRRAFADFSIERVAAFTGRDVLRLLRNEDIIRNRLKIAATIENAKRLKRLIAQHGSFAGYVSGLDGEPEAMYRELKKQFSFMGPKIAESFLLSIGKLDKVHEPGCWKAVEKTSKTNRMK
ncbi:MAG: DNA-3-methyladenine glycosylase I [Candidatus Abyssobacteria bacterium SURF_17]|jgi:DNA-3-methyladenine glycosylase I|uniref:DNA-3-methyladenine glycosylase I n=1 Tax=Candidatus Abyssobacteria bacterium SURF_17 TaxID=2093361 RepID=A0A419F2K9_9BACT|nr:MAG: DNA-3-methyladenine glycosylase I [Candidatus Abyssubacteria bacterium SURF_17]